MVQGVIQTYGGAWGEKVIEKTRSAPLKESETDEQKKMSYLERSFYGKILTPEEVEIEFLSDIAKNWGVEATEKIGQSGKFKIFKKKEEESKKKKEFEKDYKSILGPFKTLEERDKKLSQISRVGFTDLPFIPDEFEGLTCKEKGRRCQENKAMRDTCRDPKIKRKYILPCKIKRNIELLIKDNHIFNPREILRNKEEYPNILNMKMHDYLESYLSFSPSKVIDYEICVKFNPTTPIWGAGIRPDLNGPWANGMPDPAPLLRNGRERQWNDIVSAAQFKEYTDTIPTDTMLEVIQFYKDEIEGYPGGDPRALDGHGDTGPLLETLSTLKTGSFTWWVNALIAEPLVRPVLKKVGPNTNVIISGRLTASEEYGLDILDFGSSSPEATSNNRTEASVEDFISDYSNIPQLIKRGTFINMLDQFIENLSRYVDHLNIKDKTSLYEYFNEFIYLFYLGDDETDNLSDALDDPEDAPDFTFNAYEVENKLAEILDEYMSDDILLD
tara:strand:- start:2024 stop:3523 length:1500 start_codon:yes stop_codon:yes gene_type:complete